MRENRQGQADLRAQPTQPGERIDLVDVLRGFAVFGILAANMASYAGMAGGLDAGQRQVDRIVFLLIRFFVEAKFYSLFSFLFGWGMAVQMRRAASRRAAFSVVYLRRLLVLLLFGIAHGTLIWTGDILTYYALLGCILILFRHRSPRFLLVSSGAALLFAIGLSLPWAPVEAIRNGYIELVSSLVLNRYTHALYEHGTYLEVTRLRTQDFMQSTAYSFLAFGNVFAMFLLGLAAGKARIFAEIERHLPRFRLAVAPVMLLGFLLNGLFVLSLTRPGIFPAAYLITFRVGARTLGAPLLMIGYVLAITLLSRKERWRHWLQALSPVGRMALSNYILQSIFCTLLFYGYGLGFYGRVSIAGGLLLTVGIFAVQIRVSAWWIERYRFGPLEWVWRLLTYADPPIMPRRYSFEREVPAQYAKGPTIARFFLPAGVAVFLVLWGIGLLLWARSIPWESVNPDEFFRAIQAHGAAPPEANPGVDDGPGSLRPDQLRAEQLAPVERIPSTLVQSGDLWTLGEAFDPDAALAVVRELADQEYAGRQAGSPGGEAAGAYIAGRFEALGLLPVGENGSFYQTFPVAYISLNRPPTLQIRSDPNERAVGFQLNRDFSVVVGGYAGGGFGEAQVIWVDDCGREDFIQAEVAGAIAFCLSSDQQATRNALEFGAVGLLLLADDDERPIDMAFPRFEPQVPVPLPTFRVSSRVGEALLEGSGYSIQELELGLTPGTLKTWVSLAATLEGQESCPPAGCEGRNVLGLLPGRDPIYAGQVVVISAHYDHMGETPDGTIWHGANDDASGVAVMLEIARAWREHGFVPRRSVLFAAWDAEELGLLGSRYFVDHPTLALDEIYLDLQLDMVGGGGSQLAIDGGDRLIPVLESIAAEAGVATMRSEGGRSDHQSFLEKGMDATLLYWHDESGTYTDYHRPTDTVEHIDPLLLKKAGFIAHMSVLSVVEGMPEIQWMLDHRSAALSAGNLDAFLETSVPSLWTRERAWYETARRQDIQEASMNLLTLLVDSSGARGKVQFNLAIPIEGAPEKSRSISEVVDIQFVRGVNTWLWAGPDLQEVAWLPDDDLAANAAQALGIRVFASPDQDTDIASTFGPAFAWMRSVSSKLGIGIPEGLRFELFSSVDDIQLLSTPGSEQVDTAWVGPGIVRAARSRMLASEEAIEQTLMSWLLFEVGIEGEEFSWVLEGLPLALHAEADVAGVHPTLIPELFEGLIGGGAPDSRTESWAKIEYLHQRYGWGGVGRMLKAIGRACREDGCEQPADVEGAYEAALQSTPAAFERSWQSYWTARLDLIATRLQSTLDQRAQALVAGSQNAFLATVDASVRFLLPDQLAYYEGVRASNPSEWSWGVVPQVLFANGDVLARVGRVSAGASTASLPRPNRSWSSILFTLYADRLRWAGAPAHTLVRGRTSVLYPTDFEAIANVLLDFVQPTYLQIAQELGVESVRPLGLRIYTEESAMRSAIPLESNQELPQFWFTPGGSLKFYLPELDGELALDTRVDIIKAIIRSILEDAGVDREWILRGASLALLPELDGRERLFQATRYMARIEGAVRREELPSLLAIGAEGRLEPDSNQLADAQAWDAFRLLIEAHGRQAFIQYLDLLRGGVQPASAFEQAFRVGEAAFGDIWRIAYLDAHLETSFPGIAADFDSRQALLSLEALAGSAYAGRQAGSEGDHAAASYIEEAFRLAGLMPVVPIEPPSEPSSGSGEIGGAAGADERRSSGAEIVLGYQQYFDLFQVDMLRAPALHVGVESSNREFHFQFRYDFIPISQAYDYQGPVSGELVWVDDRDGYPELDLSGKVILRLNPASMQEETDRATGQGASALILVSDNSLKHPFLAKLPTPVGEPVVVAIPVIEISQPAYQELLKAAGTNQVRLQSGPTVARLGLQVEIDLPLLPPEQVQSSNVLGLLPGNDPALKDQVIILSAHYDHVGDDPDRWTCEPGLLPSDETRRLGLCSRQIGLRYSGENDDLSGIAVMLEIARLWHETGYQPGRSILFAAFGAQEPGEIGSGQYAANPPFPLDDTEAVVHLDAVAGGRGYYLEVQGTVEHDGWLTSLASQLETQADVRLSMVREHLVLVEDPSDRALPWLSWTSTSQGVHSDHLTFRDRNIPSVLITWRGSSELNLPDGEADVVEIDRLGKAGRLAALMVMSLAR